jgi:uncharacterized protein with NAD-binding domain and iron-sulfur cluster
MDSGRTRRQFLSAAGGMCGAIALGVTAPVAAAARTRTSATGGASVAVLGGGVSGLSAAHELAERGYAVTVYEYYTALGGKARSMDVPGTGSGGRKPLPGEHGFRFFPGFYRNLPDTLRRIPFPGNAHGVHDNLRDGTDALIARNGGRPDLHVPLRTATAPPSLGELTPQALRETITAVLDTGLHLPAHEAAYFANRLLVHLTSCDQRRDEQWEKVPWWDFIRAGAMSYDYQQLLGVGLTRNLVATKAEQASTRTVARTVLEAFVINGILGRGNDGEPDRVLNAPTSEAWIDPWVAHLRSLGVAFELATEVKEVVYGDGRINGVRVAAPDGSAARTVTADYYVSAMPVEHARPTWGGALRAADPQLARCDALQTDWMVGVQFYLRKPVPIIHGHRRDWRSTPCSTRTARMPNAARSGPCTGLRRWNRSSASTRSATGSACRTASTWDETTSAKGSVALSVGVIEAGLGSEVVDPLSPVAASEVGVRRVPVPAGGDHGRGALVSAVRPVVSRRREVAGRARRRGRSRYGLPVGAAAHPLLADAVRRFFRPAIPQRNSAA